MNFQEYFTKEINEWKDPLNSHMMKASRGANRKSQKWVPKSRQTEIAITDGQRVLDLAKKADQGIWRISYPEAISIARKYKMHLPTRIKPAKRLGSTGIVMWLKLRPDEEAKMYLVKHDKLLKGAVKARKKKKIKRSDSSKYKAKKPKTPDKPVFKQHHVGVK